MGMHHDGMQYYPLDGSRRGLLAINQEYTDDGLLHPMARRPGRPRRCARRRPRTASRSSRSSCRPSGWQVVRPSRYARRITANTPFAIGGPAAGHPLMKTAADPAGRTVLGTINNCASGKTPWGTYLSGEENWANYFTAADTPTRTNAAGASARPPGTAGPSTTSASTPCAPQRAQPLRLDRRGRPDGPGQHAGQAHGAGPRGPRRRLGGGDADGRAVVYSGEDARFEYIYKFVSRDRIAPAGNGKTAAQANADLLDHGTLYVARFDADGSGRWLPLVHGQGR
jgi:secreted PhoX family phosphatase